MRISNWSSDVCSSDLPDVVGGDGAIFKGEGDGGPFLPNPADRLVQRGEAGGARQFIFHFLEANRTVGGEDRRSGAAAAAVEARLHHQALEGGCQNRQFRADIEQAAKGGFLDIGGDRKSTRLNSSH